jgi:hypothetical protein
MPFTSPTPGLVPHFDVTVHIVLDDFGKVGRAYRETAEEDSTLGSVVDDLLSGQLTIRCASWPSTLPRVGHGTYQRMLRVRW